MAAPGATDAALHELEVTALYGFASKCLSSKLLFTAVPAVAGACIIAYDHILTFSDENRYITPLVLAVDASLPLPPSHPSTYGS
ncbi:hypothetical protein FRC10_002989 [Ceratobasidium sp. 414]|nr:hypothetical protein FRC10_002989 [Ceratobasidium sp. 414]